MAFEAIAIGMWWCHNRVTMQDLHCPFTKLLYAENKLVYPRMVLAALKLDWPFP